MILSTARTKDLKVLLLLCTSTTLTSTTIQCKTDIPSRSVKEVIRRLNQSIYDTFQLENFICSNNKGEIFLNFKFQKFKFEVLYKLQLLWYKESFSMQLLLLIITQKTITRNEVMNKFFISESAFQKLLLKTNRYLSKFSFKIKSSQGVLRFEGRELNIRFFIFNLLYYTHFNIEWPFTNVSINSLRGKAKNLSFLSTNKSSIAQRADYILLAIVENRYSSSQYIENNIKKEISDILRILHMNTNNFLKKYYIFQKIPYQYKMNEKLIAELCLRIYNPETDSVSEKIKLGMLFSQPKENSITKSARQIINSLDNCTDMTNITQSPYIRIYQLVIFITTYSLLGRSLIPLIQMKFPKTNFPFSKEDALMKNIESIVHTFYKNDSEISLLINCYLYNQYVSSSKEHIIIYLEFFKDTTAPLHIVNRIYAIFSKEFIIFTKNINIADLIITDTFDIKKPSAFFFNNINDTQTWQDLLFVLKDLCSNKFLE